MRTINIALTEQTPQVRTLRFLPDLTSGDDEVLLSKFYSVTTDDEGVGTIDLPTKASGPIRYKYEIPSHGPRPSWGWLYLDEGDPIDLEELLLVGAPATDSLQGYIDDQIALIDVGAGYDVLSNFETNFAGTVSAIGGTPTTLIVNENDTVSTVVVVPETLLVKFSNGAMLTKSGAGSIEFQGVGLTDPESQSPIFSGFANGDITFSGDNFPARLSSNLWDAADTAIKINRAQNAVIGKKATIVAYPGDMSEQVRLKDGLSLHLTKGTYDSVLVGAHNMTFVMEDNTVLYGDGQGQTIVLENEDSARMVYASGVIAYPFDGYNENIEVRDITFQGNPLTPIDSGSSCVLLGNVTNGSIHHCTFIDTHGFAAFCGGFADSGYTADKVYITDNTIIGLQTQYIGTIGGRNIFIQRNHLTVNPPAGASFIAAIDIEPNASTDGGENMQITDNIFDGTRAASGWNGIAMQQSYGKVLRNVIVSRNTIVGANESVLGVAATDINPGTDTITVYHSTLQTGDPVNMVADDAGGGHALPTGLGASPFAGFAIRTGFNTIKLATTKANALAGTAINITDTGGWSLYLLYPTRWLSNGLQIFGVETGIIEGNLIVGAGQNGMDIEGCQNVIVRNNSINGAGGGGSDAIRVIDCCDSQFIRNSVRASNQPTSSSTTLTESHQTITVSTTSGSNIVTVTSADRVLNWWYRGKTITINGNDYVIYTRINTTLHLNSTVPTTGSYAATVHWSNNEYYDNDMSITLASSGTSFVVSERQREIVIACSDETTNITTGTAKVTFRMPFALTLYTGDEGVRASMNTAPAGSSAVFDINATGSSILSTKLSIDAGERTSLTAASEVVISDTTLAADEEVTIDFDQVGSGTGGKGVKIILRGERS